MAEKIKIANKFIGEGEPLFIVAEAGVNHNGDIELAKKLIDGAFEAKVDAVKFQTFKAAEEVIAKCPKAQYQREGLEDNQSYYEMIKKLELNEEAHKILMDYCQEKGIIFLSTPSDEKSAEMLNNLKVPAFKIASNDIITWPMLGQVARYKKPIILSRGMATKKEIAEALIAIRTEGNDDIVVLHCISNYPAVRKDLNLAAIEVIKKEFGVLSGYSDHSQGLEAPMVAAFLGATVIEKHFTIDKHLPGPDHKFSITIPELKQMVEEIRGIEKLSEDQKRRKLKSIKNLKEILGSYEIKPAESEIQMRQFTRKSIVARYNLEKGEIITGDNIAFKRPALGIPVNAYRKIIGKKVKSKIIKDEFITFENIE